MIQRFYRARYGLLLIVLGFGSARALIRYENAFLGFPIFIQAGLVLGLIFTSAALIWKDRNE